MNDRDGVVQRHFNLGGFGLTARTAVLAVLAFAALALWAESASAAPPANDDLANAVDLTGSLPITQGGTNSEATAESGEPDHTGFGFSGNNSAWYTWTPASNMQVAIETCNSATPTLPAVYLGSTIATLGSRQGSAAFCAAPNGNKVTVTLSATAGTTYRIAVDRISAFSPTPGAFSLVIREIFPPANDDFADAESIAAAVPSTTPGTNANATAESGEPPHAGPAAQNSVWYSWTPPSSGLYSLDTCGSFTRIATYTGGSLGSLVSQGGSTSGCGGAGARLALNATLGTTYSIAVDVNGPGGAAFNLAIREFNPPANDDFADAETIAPGVPSTTSGTTLDASFEPGEPNHGPSAAQSSVWYSWTPTVSGSYALDTCASNVGGTAIGVYTGSGLGSLTQESTAGSACGANAAQVNLNATANTTYWIAVDGKSNQGPFSLRIRQPSPPANDNFSASATIPAAVPSSTNGNTMDATRETGEPNHASPFAAPYSVWYSWTPTAAGPYNISTCVAAPTNGTVVAVYTGTSVDMLSLVVSSGFGGSCPSGFNGARVTLNASASTTYRIAVAESPMTGGIGGPFTLKIEDPDTTPPTTQITDGPAEGSTINDRTPTFTMTSNEPGSFQCNLDGSPFIGCSSPATYPELGDGPHTAQIRAVDSAGNIDPTPEVRNFTVDATPPNTAIDTGPSGPTNNNDPAFTFSSEVGATFECRLDGPGAATGSFASCTSPRSFTDLADGDYTLQVRATDSAGNTDGSAATRSFTVDTGAPSLSIDSGPSGPTNNPSPSFGFTAEGGSTVTCSIDTGTASFAPCSGASTHSPSSPLADGPFTFRVRATDGAGNVSNQTRSFTVDTAAPNTTIDSGPAAGATIPNAAPSFTFSSNEGAATFECRVDSGAFATCISPSTLSGLSDGSHTFEVRAKDGAGNQDGSPASRTFTVDTSAPDTTIDSGPSGTITTNSGSFAFSSTEGGSSFECRLDGGAFAACSSPTALSGLANGSHTFEVRSTDGVGNVDGSPASRTFTVAVSTTPPVNQACEDAKDDLEAAQAKVAKAKTKVKKAKTSTARKKAKKALKKAKAALKKAQAAVEVAC